MTWSTVSCYWLKYTYYRCLSIHTNMVRSNEYSSSVTSPSLFFRRRSIIFAWNRITKFSRFLSTIFRICKWIWIRAMTATRSAEHLWRARSNRGGVGADHNSLIVFQIHDNRRSAPAIGNLLPRIYVNNSLFVILTAQCFIDTFLKCILHLNDINL